MDINHKDKPENTFEISKTQFYCKITSLSKKHTLWTVTFSIKAKIDNKLKISKNHEGDLSQKLRESNMWIMGDHIKPKNACIETSSI